MKFCEHCENMLYISVTDDNKMKFYCKNCNFTTDATSSDAHVVSHVFDDSEKETHTLYDPNCVSSVNYNVDTTSYKQYVNPLIKYDPTLPHVNNIACPKDCIKGTDKENDVIYIKYDHQNMYYLYFCCNCEHFWR